VYLEATRPKDAIRPGLFPFAQPKAKRLTPEEASWMRRVRTAEHPLTALQDLRDGTLTQEAVETLAATAPSLLGQIRQEAVSGITAMAQRGESLPIDKEMDLALLLDVETPYTDPAFLAAVQASKTPPQEQDQQGPGGAPPARPFNIKNRLQTEGERIES